MGGEGSSGRQQRALGGHTEPVCLSNRLFESFVRWHRESEPLFGGEDPKKRREQMLSSLQTG